jgi:predicted site-specific integrase-resolvase
MENPLNNGCKPNEHYGISKAAALLGVTRPTIYRYIKLGYIRLMWHKNLDTKRIKGTEIIGFYNRIS